MGSVSSNRLFAEFFQVLARAGNAINAPAFAASGGPSQNVQAPQFNGGPSQDTFSSGNTLFAQSGATPLVADNGAPQVALLEVYPDDPFNPGGRDGHDDAVRQTLNNFAPDAQTQTFSFYTSTRSPSGDDTPTPFNSLAEVNQYIDQSGYDTFHTAAQKIEQIQQTNPGTDVINMSLGLSKKGIYQSVMDSAVNADPATGMKLAGSLGINPADLQAYYSDPNFANPQTRANIQSPAKTRIEDAIANYVDNRFNANTGQGQNFQTGIAEWRQATKQVADNGTVVVVAAGNDHNVPGFEDTSQSGSELNLLAMSDNVISVAASTDNSPNGRPADFSSRGGGQFTPTLSADGTDIPVTLDGRRQTVNGTSFSTPTVSAAVAELKKQNPNLSFQQIKNILTSTADNTAAPPQAEGVGILDTRQAFSVAGNGTVPTGQAQFQPTPVPSGNTGGIDYSTLGADLTTLFQDLFNLLCGR